MSLFGSRMVRRAVLSLSALALAACGEFTSVDTATSDEQSGGEESIGTGMVAITMQQTSGGQAGPAAAADDSEDSAGPIDLGIVASLTIDVTSIQFLPAVQDEDDENDDAAWIVLDLDEPVTIDLLNLPTEGESPLVIAAGEVDAGDYRMVRFLVGDASILFTEAFTVGQAEYDGEHAVTVPSGAETGLKTDVTFTVEADEDGNPLEVGLLFDADGTLPHAIATGSGMVIVTPVFHQNMNGGAR